jgi:hypothetical protein
VFVFVVTLEAVALQEGVCVGRGRRGGAGGWGGGGGCREQGVSVPWRRAATTDGAEERCGTMGSKGVEGKAREPSRSG